MSHNPDATRRIENRTFKPSERFEEMLADTEFEKSMQPSIQEQIEALTQELRPYPTEIDSYFYAFAPDEMDGILSVFTCVVNDHPVTKQIWLDAHYASTNKAEVEEYADCYKRLKLYQLLGKKAEKEFPLKMFYAEESDRKKYDSGLCFAELYYGTDFGYVGSGTKGQKRHGVRACVLGGAWFSREEDRLEALKICGITKEMQEKMSKYGLGGA